MQNVSIKDKKLSDLFPEVISNDSVRELFDTARIQNINVYKKSRKLEIFIVSDTLIPAKTLDSVEQSFKRLFELEQVHIRISFNVELSIEEVLNEYWDSILYIVKKNIALCRGILSGCKWKIEDNKLCIYLKTKGTEILKCKNCHALIENIIQECFGLRIRVEFKDFEISEDKINEYIEFKENEEAKVVTNTVIKSAPKPAKTSSEAKSNTTFATGDKSEVILGKSFNDSVMIMSEVTQDSGRIAIRGEIISTETRELKSGKLLYIFDVTDLTSSITVKIFLDKDKSGSVIERLKEKTNVKIRGEAQYDKFSKELTVIASDIVQVSTESRSDNADEKRVELHLHTQMSAMDGVTSVKELIKRAAQWGHKAIAITDHGVVQAYPDACDTAKKNKIKVIYGIEAYLLDDSVPIVYHSNGYPVDGEFVVFDIETTGLSTDKDKITEIGAVKIKEGKIVDTFSTFVNPEIPIPEFIVKLTGITDDMVADAPTIETVLPEFIEFVGNCPLVAHNAVFDTGFIRHNACLINKNVDNPVIDTLELSRQMFPELKKHKLDIVAKHLGVSLENHHRALDDAKACAGIFVKCLEILDKKDVKTIDDIQNAFEGCWNYQKANSYHAIILVKNYVGLKNLYKIVSQTHLEYFYKRPRLPRKLLMMHREGLILGSACEAGELYRAILDNKNDDEISRIVRFYDYLEIQPLGNNQFLLDNGKVNSEEDLKNINRKIVALGEKYNKPVVATCDVHFMDPKDEVFRRILMAGQGFSDADNQAPLYFRTTDEMMKEFDYLGEEKCYEVVVTNTNLIADQCEDIIPVPDGTFPPKIDGAEEEIKTLAQNKATEIYGETLPEIVEKRMEKELNSIIKNGFSVMYIIAQKLVWKSLSDGYLVGSRGSVGSSFVAYLIGITEVNSLPPHYVCESCKYSEFIEDGSYGCGFDMPEKTCPNCGRVLKKDGYDIPFETFLGFDGDKEPDIDLNFSGEYQPVAHKYTEELFGVGHVYRAGTIGTIAEKTAYGFVKNYLDERGIVTTNAEINRLVKGCTGVKRTTGQHPGGVMIVPQDREIYEFCPIQRPADDTTSDIITTHFDYHSISGRLLKLDILGHDDPTVIRMLEDLTGVNARTIPIGEKKTMGLFSSTESLGISPEDINSPVGTFAIPEFGTRFVRQMLVDTKPTTFSELIRISGLSHGTDVWLNNAQDLVRNNIASLPEVICTRDDIMLNLIHYGLPDKTAFKIMEDVRKGKGLKEEYEQIMREKKVPDWYIDSCKKIKYMFPKAHAAAYVMMAFRIAWFKVYYPEAFYVAYFTVRADEFDAAMMCHGKDKVKNKIREFEQKGNNMTQKEKNTLTILEVANEMYARGIKFLPIDIYKSDAVKFQIAKEGIRPPLNALQGLGSSAAQNIVEARNGGEFLSVDDLRVRAKVSKAVIEILQQNGCLDGLPESNQISLFG
ncbi:PolC-type DNA polymerase III [Acetivibrio mesophilus]|uniref:DNA polymerase III PolC-type n=1 Tax=Acetivibrio mesophilus TaxID=2487273 RepID=A0A4V1K2C6_9FIRM|nr:PolC-type DNA polymerase III [Acetivibrio mesophilus]ODM25163.1 PolC-type DNA polymerase III [Clostridium sp. Bc-iso-3]RXE59819.1 PolC-type DNA polymerase III [Acetivibrio mesophilus]HHV29605.1 PolC-type DNA polymerase III [Clostridium sp.]